MRFLDRFLHVVGSRRLAASRAAPAPPPDAVPIGSGWNGRRAFRDRLLMPCVALNLEQLARGIHCARHERARRARLRAAAPACRPAAWMPCIAIALFSRTAGSGTSAIRLRQRARPLHQLVMRNHLVDHADAQRLLRVEMIAGQRPAVGRLPAAQRGRTESSCWRCAGPRAARTRPCRRRS